MRISDVLLEVMIAATLISLGGVLNRGSISERLAALASVSVKLSIVLLMTSVLRDDWMVGLVAIITLISGEAGLILLANLRDFKHE